MKKTLKVIAITTGILLVLLITTGIGLYLASPKPFSPPKKISHIREIDNYFQKLTENRTPPSLSITVLKNSRFVYQKAFGFADGPKKIKATIDTIYPWWSVTKLFTATAIMQLVEMGKIDLDDPVQKFLPYFTARDKKGNMKTITVRQLLNHSSGLRDFIPDGLTWVRLAGEPQPDQTEFFKEKILKKFTITDFEPGSKTGYTNTGYHVLGVIIESVAGMEYNDYVTENILVPLNMQNSAFVRSETLQEKTATGTNPVLNIFTFLLKIFADKGFFDTYVRETEKGVMWFQPIYTNFTPSTGLSGTGAELARFGNVFLQDGIFENNPFLSAESVQKMLKPFTLSQLGKTYNSKSIGLGWKAWKINNRVVYSHGGGGPGFGALLVIVPGTDLVAVILANDTNIDRNVLARLLVGFDWK